MNTEQEVVTITKPPFPWFGGKSRVAKIVWQRFGDVANYVEPFFGSGAVLLRRPTPPGVETVNDLDCYLANFWRAMQHDPEAVAMATDWPVNEADLHARHQWLVEQATFRERMRTEPDYFDPKIAGWWVWGQCQWIGSGWCDSRCYDGGQEEWKQLPHLGDPGRGVHRPSQKLPHLGDPGRGVHRPSQKLPHLGDPGQGELYDYFAHIAARLRRVRVCCGDWARICGPTPTRSNGITGVMLDPPYGDSRKADLYAQDSTEVAADVFRWAIDRGGDKMLRIAFCGYDGEFTFPDSWEVVAWKAAGGYGSQGDARGKDNAHRERIWFSPGCQRNDDCQMGLF
jgi:hypothetical protein